jgi:peptidoglycan/LPS O-acetylase OafA/YrhL/lysophospholipase L1-like esterase
MSQDAHRLASLDLLRGIAALTVAVAHYLILGSNDWRGFETGAVLAVEVFFVLSGFVLAPQLIGCASSPRRADVGIFLVKRWMRTVPPYLVALLVVTVLSGQVFSREVLLYALYIQNLTHAPPPARDYFAVAWSLSVEEWFYVLFAAVTLVCATLRLGTRGLVAAAVILALASEALRLAAGTGAGWDAAVRRVTVLRLDSIAFGFLLYVGLSGIDRRLGDAPRALLGLGAVGVIALAGLCGFRAVVLGDALAQQIFPFSSALFGSTLIVALFRGRALFQMQRGVAALCYFLGRVSYTVYLFHLAAILLLRPLLSPLPLLVQLALYLAALVAFCALFFAAFERPILAARPRYRGFREAGVSRPRPAGAVTAPSAGAEGEAAARAPSRDWRAHLAAVGVVLAALVGLWFAIRLTYLTDRPVPFYASILVAAVLVNVAFTLLGLARLGVVRVAGLALLLFCLVLPAADAVVGRRSGAVQRPDRTVYFYRDSRDDPDAFRAWWAFVVQEWMRGAKKAIAMADPEGKLPYLPAPNARSRFFDADIRINNFGFRGPDITADKGDRYRIFVIGESPTFGTMMKPGEQAWPQLLGERLARSLACARPIEVVNAGVVGYGLGDSLERLRRFILPLRPDMVVAYHGWNDLAQVDPVLAKVPEPPQWTPRGSPLIGDAVFRLKLLRYTARMAAYEAQNPTQVWSTALHDRYAQFIDIARAAGFRPVLTTLSTAVTPASPREVIDFYGRTFMPIDRRLAAVEEHNRMLGALASASGTALVDSRPGLAGGWDDDLFVDIVHLTQKGSERLADRVAQGLAPVLAAEPELRCTPRAEASGAP